MYQDLARSFDEIALVMDLGDRKNDAEAIYDEEGCGDALADTVIRMIGLANAMDIDLANAVVVRVAKESGRHDNT